MRTIRVLRTRCFLIKSLLLFIWCLATINATTLPTDLVPQVLHTDPVTVEEQCTVKRCVLLNKTNVEMPYRHYSGYKVPRVYGGDNFEVSFRSLGHTVPLYLYFLEPTGFQSFVNGSEFEYLSGSIVPAPYPSNDAESTDVTATFDFAKKVTDLYVIFTNDSPLSEGMTCPFDVYLSFKAMGCLVYLIYFPVLPLAIIVLVCYLQCAPCRRCLDVALPCCSGAWCDAYNIKRGLIMWATFRRRRRMRRRQYQEYLVQQRREKKIRQRQRRREGEEGMEDSLLGEEDFSHPESGLGISSSSRIPNYPHLVSRVPYTATESSLEEDAGYGHADATYDPHAVYGNRDAAYGHVNDIYTPPTLQGVRRAGRRASTPALPSDGPVGRTADATAGTGAVGQRAGVGSSIRAGEDGAEAGSISINIPPPTATRRARTTHAVPPGAAASACHALSVSPEAASRLSREADPLLLDYVHHYDPDADAHASPHHIAAQDSLYFQLPDDLCHFDVAALDSDSDDDGLPTDGYGFAAGPENAVELDVLSPFGDSEGNGSVAVGMGTVRRAATAGPGATTGTVGRRLVGASVSAAHGAGANAGANASMSAHTTALPPVGGAAGTAGVSTLGGRVLAPTRLRQPRPLPNIPSYDNGYSPARNHDHCVDHGCRRSYEGAQGPGLGCGEAMGNAVRDATRVCSEMGPRARAVVVRTGVGDPVDDASDVDSVLSLQSDASLRSESSLASETSLPNTAVDSDAVLYGGHVLVSQLHWSVQVDIHYYHRVNGVADPRGMKLHAFSHKLATASTSASTTHTAVTVDPGAGTSDDTGADVGLPPAVCVSVPRVKALQALAAAMGDATEVATEHHCNTAQHCSTAFRSAGAYHCAGYAAHAGGGTAHERGLTHTRTHPYARARARASGVGTGVAAGAVVAAGRGRDTAAYSVAHGNVDDVDVAVDAEDSECGEYPGDTVSGMEEEIDKDMHTHMSAAHYSSPALHSTTSTSSSPCTSAVPDPAFTTSGAPMLSLGPDAIIIDNTASATNTTPFRNPSFDPYLSPLLIQPATCCLCCVYKPYERTRPPRIPLSRPGGHSLMWCLYRHNTLRLERAYDAWWRQAVVPINERALAREAGDEELEQRQLIHGDSDDHIGASGATAGNSAGGAGRGMGVPTHVARAEEQKQASPSPHNAHANATTATTAATAAALTVPTASSTTLTAPSQPLAGMLLTHNSPAQTVLFADGATSTGINVQVTAAGRWILCPPPHIVDIYNLPGEDSDEHWYSYGYMAFGANNLYTAYDDTAVPVALRRHELREYTQSKGVRADYAAVRERVHQLGSEHTLLRINPAKEHLNIVTHTRGAFAGLGGHWGASRSVWLGRALPSSRRGHGRDGAAVDVNTSAGVMVEYTPSSTAPLAPHGQHTHTATRESTAATSATMASSSASSSPSSHTQTQHFPIPTTMLRDATPAYDYSAVQLGACAREDAAERAMLEFERYQDAVQRRRLRALLPRTLLPDAVAEEPTDRDALEAAGALGRHGDGDAHDHDHEHGHGNDSGQGSGYYNHYTPATDPVHATRTRPQSQPMSSPAVRGWLGLAYNEPGMQHGGGCARVSGMRAAWLCVHADAPVGLPHSAAHAGDAGDRVHCGESAGAVVRAETEAAACADSDVSGASEDSAIVPASNHQPARTTTSPVSTSASSLPRPSPPHADTHTPPVFTSPGAPTSPTTVSPSPGSPTVYLHGDALPAHACLPAPPAVYTFDPDRWLVPPSHVRSRCACLYAILPGAGRVRCPHFPSMPFLDYFIGRPRTDYAHWWRQRQLLFWVWNPPMDEEITQFRHRLILLVFVLCFNLTVLTTWANAFGSVSGRIASQLSTIPYIGKTLVLYVSTNLLQAIFVGLARPFMSLTLSKLPVLQRSPLRRTRFLGYLLYYTCLLVAVFFLLFVLLGVFVLIMRYRCDVLYTQVLYPFAVLTLLNLFYAYSIVPLPVLYHLQNAYGSMPAPIGGGYLDHLRAEHARLGAHVAAVDGALVPYTEEQLFEHYVRKGEGDRPR